MNNILIYQTYMLILIILIFLFSCCELPPEPVLEHKLVASALFSADKKVHSVFVDTTYDLGADYPYWNVFPMPGISNATVEMISSDSVYQFIEDTTYYGLQGDYVCSLIFQPGERYQLCIEYKDFDPLEISFVFPDSISILYPINSDTIQVGSRLNVTWTAVNNINIIDKYLFMVYPNPSGIGGMNKWINRNDTIYIFEKFGMSVSENKIISGFTNNSITIKVSATSIYSSEDIKNGYGYFQFEFPDSVVIFSSIDSISSIWSLN